MTNKITKSLLVLAVGGVMLASAAAQTTTTAPPASATTATDGTTQVAPATVAPAGTQPAAPPTNIHRPSPQMTKVRSGPGVYDKGHPRINQVDKREENQQQRVGNDIKNGSMTAGQAAQVEREDARIQRQEKADIAKDGGTHLTKAQQRQLNREQNHVSRQIYKDKHSKR